MFSNLEKLAETDPKYTHAFRTRNYGYFNKTIGERTFHSVDVKKYIDLVTVFNGYLTLLV